ncbi:MAG: ATP-binding cassette domain-containing protein [Mesorhizobium sp.]|nr:MAG: ATP-binding cassette domain-containing protein [Mesorhizobium sp.]
MATVELRNVSKSYGSVPVLDTINLTVADGEFTVFVGPSGCGKSTLLRMIAGLADITEGDLLIDGIRSNDLTPKQRNVAMVFQSYALYPQMNVRENMAFGLTISGLPRPQIAQRVDAQMLGLKELFDRRPGELSGGQRQRVAIGRAIVREPRLFLLDEPLSNLDASLRSQMRVELSDLHRRLRTTMIYVTHDQIEAMTLASRIVVLSHGRIEQIGTPMEIYNKPASRFVGEFIGSPKMNFISGEIASQFDAESVGIRPEHLSLADTSSGWLASVTLVERLGSDTVVYARSPVAGNLTVRLGGQHDFEFGQELRLSVDRRHLHRFGRDGGRLAA